MRFQWYQISFFLYIHQRLIEIFGYVSDFSKPFAGLTLILVGDLHQLPPVMQKPIYAEFNDDLYNIYPLWRNFQMCELTEVMRQRGDTVLIDLLNNVRLGILYLQDYALALLMKTVNITHLVLYISLQKMNQLDYTILQC